MRVPLRADVIQIGTADTLPTATIELRAGTSSLSVHRTDGRPIQAQIVHRRTDGHEWLRTVFRAPVAGLRLRRLRTLNGPRVWVVANGINARHEADLVQLVQTIVCFGAAKQNRDECAASARPA